MYTISKQFAFSAAHQLHGLPKDHPCSNLHGHNYVVIVELQSTYLNKVGFILDYRALSPIKEYIDEQLDHRNLNDVLLFNPTAELMAEYFYHEFRKLFELPERNFISAVSVQETPKTIATYRPKQSKTLWETI